MIAAGEFLEWAPVFGNLYGTCASDTERADGVRARRRPRDRRAGRAARCGRQGIGTSAVFVMPPSFEVLEQRLRGRSKDSEAEIQRRLQVARDEVAAFAEYDYVVVNDELPAAVDRLRSIVIAERARLQRMRDQAETHSQDLLMIDRSKLSNSFEFVVTAGARARQLLAGSTPRVTVGEHKKTTVAQQEVVDEGGGEDRTRDGGSGNRVIGQSVIDCSICDRLPDYPITRLPDVLMLIALGVTGGIGAYKAVEVARGLQKRGHEVVAVMTHSATRFVGADHVRGDHAPPRHHRSVRRRG